jgi:hypothetical protein
MTAAFNFQKIECEGCRKAWKLYKKSVKLAKKGIKRQDWLRILSAKALYEDRTNHADDERQCPLIIVIGRARRQKQFICWNCEKTLYASWSRYSESVFCRYCFATLFNDWIDGKINVKEVQAMFTLRSQEPYMSPGLWDEFRWDKEKDKMVPRRKKNG